MVHNNNIKGIFRVEAAPFVGVLDKSARDVINYDCCIIKFYFTPIYLRCVRQRPNGRALESSKRHHQLGFRRRIASRRPPRTMNTHHVILAVRCHHRLVKILNIDQTHSLHTQPTPITLPQVALQLEFLLRNTTIGTAAVLNSLLLQLNKRR